MSGPKHSNATSFQPGRSGNPAGRKKGVERRFREVASERTYTDREGNTHSGIDALAHVLLDIALNPAEEAKDRKAAVDSYIDRGWGKVKQAIELSGEVGDGSAPEIDWSQKPLEERRKLLELAAQLGVLEDDSTTEH